MSVCSAVMAAVRLSSKSEATKSHPGNRSHEEELKEPRVFNQRTKSQNGKGFMTVPPSLMGKELSLTCIGPEHKLRSEVAVTGGRIHPPSTGELGKTKKSD